MNKNYWVAICVVLTSSLPQAFAAEEGTTTIVNRPEGKGPIEWAKYLQDTAAGSVSAAGMLGISGESITAVENVRDVVVALKGLGDDESKRILALSITPARTELTPMSYDFYRNGGFAAQLLGSFTIGYAQGDAEITATKYERRAVSAETSFFFDPVRDDPVIAFGERLEAKYVPVKAKDGSETMGDVCDVDRDPGVLKARAAAGDGGGDDGDDDGVGSLGLSADNPVAKAQAVARRACHKAVTDGLRWNRSRASLAYATGWIKGKDGGVDDESLGHTIVAGVIYGIGESWAVSGTYRHSVNEPILETLGTATARKKDASLLIGQVKYGSKKIRALLEASDAKSNEVTASQRAFRQAVGVDFRVYEATWLNFRYGRQREVDGDGDENGSLLTISYSPSALLH